MARGMSATAAIRWRIIALALCAAAAPASAQVVTRLPTSAKVVALTFDACQAFERMPLDHGIVDYLLAHHIPFTVFLGGRFARDNADGVRALAARPEVEIENHSWSHRADMRTLPDERVRSEVSRAEKEIKRRTGRATRLFRFPSGISDERTVALVEALGYQVVHWRYASGDPDPRISADDLVRDALARTSRGDILIYHVNGRGLHTAEALPRIVDGLAARGYHFVRLAEYLHPAGA
jgi:peptidoglycan/xylan/chitin deacetylase (PgdA/CDA1 family)